MSVKIGEVKTFPNVEPSKEQALKILEEAAEVFAAWQNWYEAPEQYELNALMDECADVIQATCNLLAAYGIDDFRGYMRACKYRNAMRGRYVC